MAGSKSLKASECSTATNAPFCTKTGSISSAPTRSSKFSILTDVKNKISDFWKKVKPKKSVKKIRVSRRSGHRQVKRPRCIQKWAFDCRGCKRPISERDVRTDNAVYALEATWHRAHLSCFKCGCSIGGEHIPFLKESRQDETSVPICLDCYMADNNPKCTVCETPLFERCIQASGKKMHQTCFVCERCKAPFQEGKYAMLQDKPYDIDCYFQKFYENCLNQNMSGEYQSPPPLASMSDSSSTLNSDTDSAGFKRKNAEFVMLSDCPGLEGPGKTESDKSRSAESLDVDVIIPKTPLSSEGHILLGPNASKEKASREKASSKEKMPGNSSKEKLSTSKESLLVPKLNGSKESLGEALPIKKKKDDSREKSEESLILEEDSKRESKRMSSKTSTGNATSQGKAGPASTPTDSAKQPEGQNPADKPSDPQQPKS